MICSVFDSKMLTTSLPFCLLVMLIKGEKFVESDAKLNNSKSIFKSNSRFNSYNVIENPKLLGIGAMLNGATHEAQFLKAIREVNTETNILPPGVTINGYSLFIDSNPVKNVLNICRNLFSSEVYGVIVDDSTPLDAIIYTTTFHNMPTIGISNRDIVLSDKSVYPTFVRTVSPHSHQADVWIELLNYFSYNCVVFIHSNDIDGRSTQNRFVNLADLSNLKVENVIGFEPEFPDIKQQLKQTKLDSSCRVFIIYTNSEDSEAIFSQIIMLNMTVSGYVWIVSEEALNAKNKPIGTLALKLRNSANIEGHIKDSVKILAKALSNMYDEENITKPPSDCKDLSKPKWQTGSKLFHYLKKQNLTYGKTGHVAFDERGDRINSDYDIVNVNKNRVKVVGQYYFSNTNNNMILSFNETDIIWPGNVSNKPIGYEVPSHLRVATISEKPFVYVYSIDGDEECSSDQIPCPIINSSTGIESKYCCEGYCIDLLKNLAQHLNFTYTLHQVEDGLYGGHSFVNGSERKVWTGLIGELINNKADMVVAPLTINPERSLAIDFTKPFKYQGLIILEKKQSTHRHRHPLASFLQPFQNTLWVLVGVSVHVVALALYLLDRFSPFGRYKLPNCDATEEDALNLSSAVWFAWGVLLNSGIGEGTPRSFSGRVLGMVWAGFAMIVVASYTANLAAFLVLDRPATALTGINDARLRHPAEDFKFATIRDSAVDMYFRRQIELSSMYTKMQENYYQNTADAIAAVKSGALNAFIWDSARLEYETAIDCELSRSGELFGRSGYAIGLQKENDFWTEKVTLHLLTLHEIGFMEDLDNKWILLVNEKGCQEFPEHSPATLGLKNMAGVFILVSAGIFGGIGLILFEILYKKRHTRRQRQMDLARNALDRWKSVIDERKSVLDSSNESSKKYKRRQQFIEMNQKRQYSHESTNVEKYIALTPFTVEKGINEIRSESSQCHSDTQCSTNSEHRPKLKREYSFSSDNDIEMTVPVPTYSSTDLPEYTQISTQSANTGISKVGSHISRSNANYFSLV